MLYPDETCYEMTDAEYAEREAYYFSYHCDTEEEPPSEASPLPFPATDLPF